MKKIISLILVLLLSFSLFAADPSVLVSLLAPGLLYSGEPLPAAYDLSSVDESALNAFLIPQLLDDGGVSLAGMVEGPAMDIVQGFFGLAGALMPLDHMYPVAGSGTVTLSVLPPLSENDLSIGASVDYDDAMVLYAVEGRGDGSVTFDGRVEAYIDISTPSLFTFSVSASSFMLSGSPLSGSVELSVELDDEMAASYMAAMGADMDLYRMLFSAMIIEGYREMGISDAVDLEAILGISIDEIASGDLVAYLEENEMLDLIDLMSLVAAASDSSFPIEEILLSVLSAQIVIDGSARVDVDARAFLEALAMMDSL